MVLEWIRKILESNEICKLNKINNLLVLYSENHITILFTKTQTPFYTTQCKSVRREASGRSSAHTTLSR